jgi:putative DNA primase/helicase
MGAQAMTAAEIAQALGGATRNGRGWSARCPCHQDKAPSLSLRDGDSQLLVHCFAGCNSSDILTEFRQRGWLDDDRKRDFRPARRVPPLLRVITNSEPINGSEFARRIWRESIDPRGTLAEK